MKRTTTTRALRETRDWTWERICDAAESGLSSIVIRFPENEGRRRWTIHGLGILSEDIAQARKELYGPPRQDAP